MQVNATNFTVLYNNKNITNEISKYMMSLTYSDKVKGESDEVEIELEDVDELWKNNWYPEKGAKLTVTIGTLKCGVFEIDEIEIKGPPDTVTIRGMATGITNTLRTKRSDANENKSLKQIAQKIADRNGFDTFENLPGSISNLIFGRSTQNKETDLAYLKRISNDNGVAFSIKGNKMVFDSIYNLENRKESFTVDKTQITAYSLKDKADGMVKTATVKSKNAKKNASVSTNLEFEQYKLGNPAYTAPPVTNQDAYVSSSRVENTQQAESKAKAIMHTSASNQQTGRIEIPFNPLACAGNNFKVTGIGLLSGKYHITSSSHRIDKSGGAVSELEVKRLRTPAKNEQITKKKKKSQSNNVAVFAMKNVSVDGINEFSVFSDGT